MMAHSTYDNMTLGELEEREAKARRMRKLLNDDSIRELVESRLAQELKEEGDEVMRAVVMALCKTGMYAKYDEWSGELSIWYGRKVFEFRVECLELINDGHSD